MKHLLWKNILLSFMAAASVIPPAAAPPVAADSPSQPIEYVTHAAPGGSMDVLGRFIQRVIKEEKILSQPLVVVNKSGSGGAVSYGFVFERKGNPYTVLATTSGSFLATPLRENLPYNYASFAPICNLIADGSVLVVKSDSPFKTIDDLIEEARRKPKTLNQAGASFTSNESLMGKQIQKAKGVQWDFISFAGGDAEAVVSVLGGNAHFTFANPASVIEHVKAGKLRVLLTGAPSRYEMFKDVPTIQERGLGAPIAMMRGLTGPPDMPDYAVKYLEAAFKKVFDSRPFQKYMSDNLMLPFWLSSKNYGKFLAEENERTKGWLGDVGLLKKKQSSK